MSMAFWLIFKSSVFYIIHLFARETCVVIVGTGFYY